MIAVQHLRECKIKEGPRKLLVNVKGLELVEMNEWKPVVVLAEHLL